MVIRTCLDTSSRVIYSGEASLVDSGAWSLALGTEKKLDGNTLPCILSTKSTGHESSA